MRVVEKRAETDTTHFKQGDTWCCCCCYGLGWIEIFLDSRLSSPLRARISSFLLLGPRTSCAHQDEEEERARARKFINNDQNAENIKLTLLACKIETFFSFFLREFIAVALKVQLKLPARCLVIFCLFENFLVCLTSLNRNFQFSYSKSIARGGLAACEM